MFASKSPPKKTLELVEQLKSERMKEENVTLPESENVSFS